MCEQCSAEMDSWGEVLPGWYLMRATRDGRYVRTGQWCLVQCNDPDIIFDTTPIANPWYGLSDDEINARPDEDDGDLDFYGYCNLFDREIAKNAVDNGISGILQLGAELLLVAKNVRFDEESPLQALCHYLARVIEDNPVPVYPNELDYETMTLKSSKESL